MTSYILPGKKHPKLQVPKPEKVEFPEEIDEQLSEEEDLDAVEEEDLFENPPTLPPPPGEGP